MKSSNYTRSITVSNTPNATFIALTKDIELWWTKPDKPLEKIGDRAKFMFPPGESYWTFEATTLKQNELVEMRCVDALHIHEGQPKEIEQEWLGTVVSWRINSDEGLTTIYCDHIGLIPELLCYEVCKAGWDYFFVDSLKSYLDTGVGSPHKLSV